MKYVSFFEEQPGQLPAGYRLYSLSWKQRYNARSNNGPPPELAGLRYFVDGPSVIDGPVPHEVQGASFEYLVDDQVHFMRPGSGPGDGGVLRLLLSQRNPSLTRKQFAWHWRNVHAPLALGMQPSYDYYITNIVDEKYPDWDGVLQEWFADEQVFDEHDNGLTGRKLAVAEDYPLFLAPNDVSPQWLGREITT
jgi:hypothetical protein